MTIDDQSEAQHIAVIGMAAKFPGADDISSFWKNLIGNVESIRFLSEDELALQGISPELLNHPNYIRAASTLDDIHLFAANFFDISIEEAEIMDPQHRLLLEYSFLALENAGYSQEEEDKRIAVYSSVGISHYLLNAIFTQPDLIQKRGMYQLLLGNDKSYAATRVSHKLNLTGPSINIDTACSSSLVAVAQAVKSLLAYECDMALAGGAKINIPQNTGYLWSEGGIFSKDGHCRPFDVNASGTVFGSGVGMVVLKRLAEAKADGDTIYAVIRGVAVNNDGAKKVSYMAPSITGQASVIAEAMAVAEVTPDSVSYIEAHGTATSFGDAIEVSALNDVFKSVGSKTGFCAIGSLKSNIGYLEVASGIAGLIKTVLSLQQKKIPASLNFQQANAEINFSSSPFYVNTQLQDWNNSALPRRAGVSSFGIGGTNAHIVLEEWSGLSHSSISRSEQLIILSAKTSTELIKKKEDLANYIENNSHVNMADVAFTLQLGRLPYNYRSAVVSSNHLEAISQLRSSSTKIIECNEKNSKIVFLFSDSGIYSHQINHQLYQEEPKFREVFQECSSIINQWLTSDIYAFVYEAGSQELSNKYQQLVTFVLLYSLASMWKSYGIIPQFLLAKGVGEYVAACIAEVFTLNEAIKLLIDNLQFENIAPIKGDQLHHQVKEVVYRKPKIALYSLSTKNDILQSQYWSQVLLNKQDDSLLTHEIFENNKVIGFDFSCKQEFSHLGNRINPAYEILVNLQQLWLAGMDINWKAYHQHESRCRLSLPGYPFERQNCWINLLDLPLPKLAITHEAIVTTTGFDKKIYAAPRNDFEEKLVALWEKNLQVTKIGIHDHFFEVGGNSILAIKLINAAKDMGIAIKPMQLFRYPTIAQLAATYDSGLNLDIKTNQQLADEVVLPNDVILSKPKDNSIVQTIFFTGGTGFVGAFLLDRLIQVYPQAKIYCLIRAKDVSQAEERLKKNLQHYKLWKDIFQSQLIAVPGDLEQASLGLTAAKFLELATITDVIVHCGAVVNFVSSYEQLKPANIQGTVEILRLSSLVHLKPVHYISTISVFPAPEYIPNNLAKEDDNLDFEAKYKGGYAQSKWVAEKIMMLAQKRGFPVTIYRPGRVTGCTKTGVWNTSDFLCKVIKGCIQLGFAPKTKFAIDFTPVNYVSDAIVAIMQQPEKLGNTFHLLHPKFIPVREVIEFANSIGYSVKEIPYSDWYTKLLETIAQQQENALQVVIDLFEPSQEADPWEKNILNADCSQTIEALKSTDIKCPDATELLPIYFDYLIQSYFLPNKVS